MRGLAPKSVKILAFALVCCGSTARAFTYVVKKGDVLSRIVWKQVPGSVWGKSGSLSKVLAQNPQIKNPDFILPGEEIQIGESKIAEAEASLARSPASEHASVVASPAPVSDETKPSPAESRIQTTDSDPLAQSQRTLIWVLPLFSFSKIVSTDTSSGQTATLVSDLNYGFTLGFDQSWSESFETDLSLSGLSSHYSPQAAGKTLDHASSFLGDLELEGKFHVFPRIDFGLTAGATQESFSRADSSTSITLDSVMIPAAGVEVSEALYSNQGLKLLLTESGKYLAPAQTDSYFVQGGYSYRVQLAVDRSPPSSSKAVRAGAYFEDQHQNTSITSQETQILGFYLGIGFDFFSDSKAGEDQK